MAGSEVSVLLGGRAGDGINSAGAVIAQFLNHLGYFPYLYFDYPSLIRGGHNFAIIRSAGHPVGVHGDMVDFVLALNQETVTRHHARFHARTVMVYNADVVRADGQGVPVKKILMEEKAPAIMGNSAVIGAFAKSAGIAWDTVNSVFLAHMPKGADLNLRVARRAYDHVSTVLPIPPLGDRRLSLITGNEAIGLGMVAGGLSAYVSYPMTPSSSLLHFLAENAARFGITVIHPENEIAVMLMALGLSYGGQRAAVGTSGGGFCLMTEGLSLAGMAEMPVVILVSQRTGPSTGLPTYTAQSDLHFVLNAGQGEFPRFVVAPGDAQEAYFWSAVAMNIAWKFQVPAFILADKTLSEGVYGVDPSKIPDTGTGEPLSWDGTGDYRRYADTLTGISPLAVPGTKGAVLSKEMESYPTVSTGGVPDAETAIVCWGSTKGICCEVAEELGFRTHQPVVMLPFPDVQCAGALKGVRRLIAVEENATGQLASLLRLHGISPDAMVLQYDGRPFTPDTLLSRIREVIA